MNDVWISLYIYIYIYIYNRFALYAILLTLNVLNLNWKEMNVETIDLKLESYRHNKQVWLRIMLGLRTRIGSLQVGIRACLILGFGWVMCSPHIRL